MQSRDVEIKDIQYVIELIISNNVPANMSIKAGPLRIERFRDYWRLCNSTDLQILIRKESKGYANRSKHPTVFLSPPEHFLNTVVTPTERMTAEISILLINFGVPVNESVNAYLRDGFIPRFRRSRGITTKDNENVSETEQLPGIDQLIKEAEVLRNSYVSWLDQLETGTRELQEPSLGEWEYLSILKRFRNYRHPRSSKSFTKLLSLILKSIRIDRYRYLVSQGKVKPKYPSSTAEFLTVSKAAEIYGVSASFLHKHIRAGNLTFQKDEYKHKRVKRTALEEFLSTRKRIIPFLSPHDSFAILVTAIVHSRKIKKSSAIRYVKRLQNSGMTLEQITEKHAKDITNLVEPGRMAELTGRGGTAKGERPTGSERWNWQ